MVQARTSFFVNGVTQTLLCVLSWLRELCVCTCRLHLYACALQPQRASYMSYYSLSSSSVSTCTSITGNSSLPSPLSTNNETRLLLYHTVSMMITPLGTTPQPTHVCLAQDTSQVKPRTTANPNWLIAHLPHMSKNEMQPPLPLQLQEKHATSVHSLQHHYHHHCMSAQQVLFM